MRCGAQGRSWGVLHLAGVQVLGLNEPALVSLSWEEGGLLRSRREEAAGRGEGGSIWGSFLHFFSERHSTLNSMWKTGISSE